MLDKYKNKVTETLFGGTVFKMIYLLFVLLSFNGFFAAYVYKILPYFSVAISAYAVLVMLYRATEIRGYLKTPGLIFFLLFSVSYMLSLIFNVKYGYVDNLKGLVWFLIQFFILYMCDSKKPPEVYQKEYKLLSHLFLCYIFICNAIGFFMFFINFNVTIDMGNRSFVEFGFKYGRLWGVFVDPNYGAVMGVISVLFCAYYFNKTKRIWLKVLYVLMTVAALFYLVFSDSRTGLLSGAAALAIFSFFTCMRAVKLHGKTRVIRSLISVAVCAVVVVSFMFCCIEIKSVYNSYMISKVEIDDGGGTGTEPGIPEEPAISRSSPEEASDLSNRRFDLWNAGIEIFEKRPVFGVSFRNYVSFTKDNLPESYLLYVNNDFVDFASLHNTFVDILVSQGVLGAVCFLMMFIYIIIYVLRRIFSVRGESYKLSILLISVMAAVFMSMLVYSETFYMNTGGAFFFWSSLGILMHLLHSSCPRPGKVIPRHEAAQEDIAS